MKNWDLYLMFAAFVGGLAWINFKTMKPDFFWPWAVLAVAGCIAMAKLAWENRK